MNKKVSPIITSERHLRLPTAGETLTFNSKHFYKRQLAKLQKQLIHVQQAYYHQGRRAVIVFEGWDAAGKGGAIRRVTRKLDPRGFQVHPIAAPDATEQGKHYLYRFWSRLPAPGCLSLFDRSWYGRVLVERVEKLATSWQWSRAYQEINEFERQLHDDGVKVIKFFIHISEEEQLKRFEARLHNPYKRWKLTEEDIRNRQQRPAYLRAINDMFKYTDTGHAPWHIIHGDSKHYARVEVISRLIELLSDGVDIVPPPVNKSLVKRAEAELGIRIKKHDG
ncbi:polyphosphate kinase 2 family protein [Salinimonas lutimaris]|uniref:polyphosphate kinase 2 family protein n=1 Tax=Salinimonas lutimaris TaxID=914153 RepID=UPI0010C125CF|nr:polyphosphate kinase [Salinimonas lutimaris]